MILDEITLRDFGLYAGLQTITLTPPSKDKPIILIGGLNGGGKTTFLDALQLCLFGAHAKISNRGSLTYTEYLSRSIHKGSNTDEAEILISFRRTIEGREERYRVHRSWRRNGSGCKEQLKIFKNDTLEPLLSDNWSNQVEEFFPANIAHLFLFDGEQIEAYASKQDSSPLIGTAIQNLLGLDIVDQLEKDLHVLERRKRSESKDDALHSEITATQDVIRNLNKHIDALKQERAALRTHRLDRAERALREVEDSYSKFGGGLYDQRIEIERKWSDAKDAVKYGEADLRELSEGSLPLLLIRDLLESMEARARQEEKCRQARELLETIKIRDQDVLRQMHAWCTDKTVIDALKDFFAVDHAERQTLANKETVLDITAEGCNDLHAFLVGGIDEIYKKAEIFLKRQNKLKRVAEQTQIEYENIPKVDAIRQVAEKMENLKKEISEIESLYATIGQEINRQERELGRKEQALARLIETEAKEKGARDDRSRVLYHISKVRITLGAFRRSVIERHVKRIEQLVLESFQQLLRKTELIRDLSIDPESYELTLFGRGTDVLSTERLSAGERQLLAIALLWGLAKASGRPLPTVIDTPLGRLDSIHRMHFIDRYLPYASHQVILLSTDEEITGEYLEHLTPWVGRSYQLLYDDKVGQTQIKSGYFEEREMA